MKFKTTKRSSFLACIISSGSLFLLLSLFSHKAHSQTIVGGGDTAICLGNSVRLSEALVGGSYGTTSYTFEVYPYSPEPFTGGTFVSFAGNQDDQIAGAFDIGFNFCFFNQFYSQFYIGSNGWVGFTYNGSWTGYDAQPLPSSEPYTPQNCIFAPWLDWWPNWNNKKNVFYYTTGSAPNRKLVVYWTECPMWKPACREHPEEFGTFEIVLNEQNSIIENHIKYKPICQSEKATQGVQNLGGTVAFIATGRNQTVWEAYNESTRFVPSGIVWYTGGYPGGTIVGYGPDFIASPIVTTTYTVVVETCAGGVAITKDVTVTVKPHPTSNAGPDITVCTSGNSVLLSGTATNYGSIIWSTSGTGSFTNANFENPTYFPSAADITAGNVILTMQVTGQGECSSIIVTDNLVLIAAPTPIANAGIDGSVCSNSTYQLNGAATGSGPIVWTTPGDGGFNNNSIINPIYTPGANDILNGGVDLMITSNGSGPCAGVSANDIVHLSITPTPFADAGPSFRSCIGSNISIIGANALNYQSLFWTTSGTGSFVDASLLHPVYIPTATDFLAGSVILTLNIVPNSPCQAITDLVNISFIAPPTANAGPATDSFCASGSYTLSAADTTNSPSLLWSSSGTAGTLSSTIVLHPIYTPSAIDIASGSVTLTLTAYGNAPCADATDSITLTIVPITHADAGPNSLICEGSTFTLASATATFNIGVAWTSTGTGTFNDATILNPVYTPSLADITAGSVTLTLTSLAIAPCTDAMAQMTLNITRQVTASTGPNASICQTDTYTNNSAVAAFYASLSWTTNGLGTLTNADKINPSYTPAPGESGTIQLTLNATANIPCANVIVVMDLTIVSPLQIDAGPTGLICEGSFFSPILANASQYSSLLWSTSGTGTFDDATIIHPIYTPSIADNTGGSVTLTLKGIANAPCVGKTVTTILNITRQVTASAGPNASICQTDTYTNNSAVAAFYASLSWTTNGLGTLTNADKINPSYTPAPGESGTIQLTLNAAANIPCASVIVVMNLTIVSPLQIDAGPTGLICEGSFFSPILASASQYSSLLWSTSGTGTFDNATIIHPIYTPSTADITAGSVTLTLTGSANAPCVGSFVSTILNITRQVTASAGPNASICQTDTYTNNSAVAAFYASLSWTTNGLGTLTNADKINPSYTPAPGESGTIQLTLNAAANIPCASVIVVMNLTIVSPLQIDAGPTGLICEGSTFSPILASASQYSSLLWSTSGTGTFDNATIIHPIYTPSTADITGGSVTLTLTGVANAPCVGSFVTTILNITRQVTVSAGLDVSICSGTSTTLSGTVNFSSGMLWTGGDGSFSNPAIPNPVYTPGPGDLAAGSVILTLTGHALAPCGDVQDLVLITINPLPTANAGAAASICANSTYTLSGLAANALSVSWATSGTGGFNNPGILTPVYTPSIADIATGSVTLTLTAHGVLTCNASVQSSSMVLTINHLPTVASGSDATICANTTYTLSGAAATYYSTLVWTTSGDGSFLPNVGVQNPVYSPGPNDIITGTATLTLTAHGSLQCNLLMPSQAMVLTINPMPTSDVGANAAYCVNASLQQNGIATHASSVLWITSGDGTFSNTLITNPTYMPGPIDLNSGTVTLTMRAYGTLACSGFFVSHSRVLSLTPFPVAMAGPDDYICSNITTYQLNGNASDYQPGTLLWTVSGGDGSLSNPNSLNPTYSAGPLDLTTVNRAIKFTLTVGGRGNCLGQTISDDMTLLIDPVPLGNSGPDGSTCGLNPYQLAGSALYYTIINWTTPGDGIFSNPSILNPTYTPGIVDRANGNVLLSMALSGCLSGGDNLRLTVYTEPTALLTGSFQMCEGLTTPLSIALTGASPWSVSYLTGAIPTTVSGIMASPYIFTVGPSVTTTYTLTGVSDAHCPGPVGSYTGVAVVSVNALPQIFIVTATNNGNYCQGSSGVHLGLGDSENGMIYQLMLNGNPDGAPVNGTGNAIDFGQRTGTGQYTVRGTNPMGNCEAMMTGVINVVMNPTPVIDFGTTTACKGDSTYFTVTGQYINRISTWHWDFGDGTYANYNAPHTPVHQYPAAGSYNVHLAVTDTNGCQYEVSHAVRVNPLPVAFFSYNPPPCDGSTIHFTDLSTAVMPYINQWIWNYGDGSPSDTIHFPSDANASHLYAGIGSYTVTLTITNTSGCTNTFSTPVTITARPTSAFSFVSGCAGRQVSFTDNSLAHGGGAITLWQWDFGDPISGVNNTSAMPSPTHIYASGGTYTVRLKVTNYNGCSDTVSQSVNVQAGPMADFTMGAGCIGSPAQFWADSVLINPATTASYQWDFGDGGSDNSRNPSHIYNAPGTYTVRLAITDLSGCMGWVEHQHTVSPLPQAHFDATLSNCQGEAVSFTDLSSFVTGHIVRRTWDFGDGSPQVVINFPNNPNVGHQYAGSGTFNVTLTVTGSDSCQGQETRQVSILPGPLAAYQFTGACQEQPVRFTDQSQANGGTSITTWTWDFGDPASGTNNTSSQSSPTHHFTGTGTYSVQLRVSTNNGCSNTITHAVTVGAAPAVAFTSTNRCEQSPVAFTPDATVMDPSTITQWNWDFGDGSTTTTNASPTHSYANAGSYTVKLTVTNIAGCSNDTAQIINIVPLPQVNFDYTSPSCHQAVTSFTSLALAGSGYLVRWHWDFGDGQDTLITFPGIPNVGHQYANSGTFDVTLTVISSDSCTNQYIKTVTVMPNPIAAFSHGSPCAGTAINFSDASQGNGGGSLTLWHWDFGDPTTGTSNSSTLPNPAHTYAVAGTYTVILVVNTANGCSDSVSSTLTIAAPPTIGFTFQAGCSVDTTQFTSSTLVNMTTNAGWSWDFGDGTTSALPDPMHIYSQSGTYTVILTITDTSGCQNTITQPVTIVGGPAVYFSTSIPLCSAHAVTFTDGTLAGPGSTLSSWHWDFGDGGDTTLGAGWTGQIIHTYAGSGTYAVQLKAGTLQGCEGIYQRTISIGAAPAAAFGFSNTCQGSITQFADHSSTPGGITLVSWAWDFGDPASGTTNTSSLPNPTHIYTQGSSFITTLIVINAIGCSDTLPRPVAIHNKPGVGFTTDSISCLGTAIVFHTDAVATNLGAIATFDWDFGDGSPHATTQDPSHTYANASIYTVILSVSDTLGCANQISHTVSIHPLPTAAFSFSSACMQAATQFNDHSFAPSGETITEWAWDFGTTLATDTSSLQDPAYTYSQSGTYNVQLTVTTQHGCSQSGTMPVQVNAKPRANFKYTASPCSGGAVQFQDSSWTYQGIITSWQWEFEPNQYSNMQNPVHVYFNADSNYSVKLVVGDMRGCMDTTTKVIKVPAGLQAGISYAGSCFRSASMFAPRLITPTGDTLINFAWDFGDPATGSGNSSTLREPSHIFSQPSDYTVSLTAGDRYGCQSTVYQAITVYALPQTTFTWQPGVCDSTIYFRQQSSAAGGPIMRWAWDYGDGTGDTLNTGANTSHQYAQAGRYQVKLEITDTQGCTALFSDSITRGSCLVAAFTSNDTLCQGQLVAFTDQSIGQGTISQWSWDFGDGNFSPLRNPTHTYQQPGTYTIKLKISTVSGSGTTSDSTAHQIMVRPSPKAGFESKGACLGTQSVFHNTTMANGVTLTGYRWDFGETTLTSDTSSQRNSTYLYRHNGSYNVRLIAQSLGGCSDTITRAVAVYGLPQASFDITNACQGMPTYFFDHSDSALAPLVHRGWIISDSLGEEARVSGSNPVYSFKHSGAYTLVLMVADSNGCTDSSQYATQVHPVPASAFAYVQDAEGIQGQLQMENQSSGAESYEWDFGDGTSSRKGDPKVLYTQDGTYTIKLIAWNTFNCPDTTVKEYKLLVKGLYVPNAFAPGGPQAGVRLFKPVGINLASYHVEVYNSHGNLIWESKLLDEKGSPSEGWDGSYKGNLLQQDVYVWKIRAIYRDGTIWKAQDVGKPTGQGDKTYGTVTLLR